MEERLLLVDDEVAGLDILSEYFVAQGYDVAVQLGDVDTTTRDAVAAAVGAARRTLPAA